MTPQNAFLTLVPSGPETLPANVPEIFGDESMMVITTRFGPMEFGRDNAVCMPRGLLGYADRHDYGLVGLLQPGLEQFMLLQSLDDADLSFIVTPLNRDGETMAEEDIEGACNTLSLDAGTAAVLLVVSTTRLQNLTQVSVNLRAPIIVDVEAHKGWQHVLLSSRYPVRHVINEVDQNDQG
ncbi:MAG: flagellar assembly factor FliW [Alphaproteobacteria bacterium]|jgi:flagellar assembly factor FliW